jgi:hypothetical protein
MNWYKQKIKISQSNLLIDWAKDVKNRYPGIILYVWETDNQIELANIEVPIEQRHQGIGKRIIDELKSIARRINKPVTLIPQADRGYKKKLERFYRDLGFVNNKGRYKDYTISSPFSSTMYWKPKD